MYHQYRNHSFIHNPRTLTVNGVGEVGIGPNIATVQFVVRTEDKQVSQAQQENSSKMSEVIQSLIQFGMTRENIQTTSFEIRPIYDYIDGREEFRGYEVIHIISVEIEHINQAGNVIEIALQNGANQIYNFQLLLKNSQHIERQALSKALEDASGKAQMLAQQMNVNIDLIPLKIVEEEIIQPGPYLKTTFAESSMVPPIEQGMIRIQAKVRAIYQY